VYARTEILQPITISLRVDDDSVGRSIGELEDTVIDGASTGECVMRRIHNPTTSKPGGPQKQQVETVARARALHVEHAARPDGHHQVRQSDEKQPSRDRDTFGDGTEHSISLGPPGPPSASANVEAGGAKCLVLPGGVHDHPYFA